MNPNEVNPYFYDDLKAFLQERGQVKAQAIRGRYVSARQKHLEDLVGDERLNTRSKLSEDRILSWSKEQRIELLPHFVATSHWSNGVGIEIQDLYESVPEEEMRSGLARKGYNLVDLDDFMQVLQRLRIVKNDESTNYWDHTQPLVNEAGRTGLQFRLSYLERNQDSDFFFSSGLISFRYAFEATEERLDFVSKISKIVGLDDELTTAFQQDTDFYGPLVFNKASDWWSCHRRIDNNVGIKQYLRDEFRRAFDFLGSVDQILSTAQNPEIVRDLNRAAYDNEFSHIPKEEMDERSLEFFYIDATHKGLENYWLELLKVVDTDEVAGYLTDEQNASLFRDRVGEYRIFITQQSAVSDIREYKKSYDASRVEEVYFTEEKFGEYVLEDLRSLSKAVSTIDDIIAGTPKASVERDVIKREKSRIIKELQKEAKIDLRDNTFLSVYLTALNDPSTARRVAAHDDWQMRRHEFFAREVHNFDERLTALLFRERIRADLPDDESKRLLKYLPNFRKFGLEDTFVDFALNNPNSAVETIFALSSLGGADEILTKVQSGEYRLSAVRDSFVRVSNRGLIPTSYLLVELYSSDDKEGTLDNWITQMRSFADGNFDPTNELHKNLEYTRFRRKVEHERLKKHIKNHFTFRDYLTIFNRDEKTQGVSFSDQDKFEIECVAHEATLLREYVLGIQANADELGRDVVVVPNLSYGYLPVSPLVEEFEEAGIEMIIGVKVGSTESHSNREVMNSRLFKGHRTDLVNRQPIIVVVDGTYNLVTNNNRNKTARYPDAHQGYLNQVIAINDAMGFVEEDYSHVGKSNDDINRLRGTEEFRRAVDVYSRVLKKNSPIQPYRFQLWNTAGMELAVRGNRKIAKTISPYNGKVEDPIMIFCNVGVLDEQIPEGIRKRFEGVHKPAYFDDSGKIIAFDFGFDTFGVSYLNRLETEVKEAYNRLTGRENRVQKSLPTPAIIKYAGRNFGTGSSERAEVATT